jgi:hypothetical protein
MLLPEAKRLAKLNVVVFPWAGLWLIFFAVVEVLSAHQK